MGIWILEGDVGGNDPRAVLLDSVTERPLNVPSFGSREQAQSFLDFADSRGVIDVRRLDDEELDTLHTRWVRTRMVEKLESAR
jgi:hypothetical protein